MDSLSIFLSPRTTTVGYRTRLLSRVGNVIEDTKMNFAARNLNKRPRTHTMMRDIRIPDSKHGYVYMYTTLKSVKLVIYSTPYTLLLRQSNMRCTLESVRGPYENMDKISGHVWLYTVIAKNLLEQYFFRCVSSNSEF